MKKLLSILLSLVIILAFVGCNNKEKNNESENNPSNSNPSVSQPNNSTPDNSVPDFNNLPNFSGSDGKPIELPPVPA